jgi:hypothetical protein
LLEIVVSSSTSGSLDMGTNALNDT